MKAEAEVERLTAERLDRNPETKARVEAALNNLDNAERVTVATVAPEENVAADQEDSAIPNTSEDWLAGVKEAVRYTISVGLPDPADVKPGEPWLIRVGDREAVANRDGTSDEWPWSVAFFDGEADDVADKAITLVSRLVPAPRVITNPDELERLAATSIIRDGLGWPGGVTDQGELMRLNSVVLDPVELLRLGPVTVLWEAGA